MVFSRPLSSLLHYFHLGGELKNLANSISKIEPGFCCLNEIFWKDVIDVVESFIIDSEKGKLLRYELINPAPIEFLSCFDPEKFVIE